MNFHILSQSYLNQHLAGKPSFTYYERLWRQLFSAWIEHPTRKDLRAWQKTLAKTPTHANKSLGFLKAMYRWGIREECFEGENPARDIPRIKTYSRSRTFTNRELARLLTYMEFPERQADIKLFNFLIMLFCTASRVSEIRLLEWINVDWEEPAIFKVNTKNGTSQSLPLTKQAVDALRSMHDRRKPTDRYVFMGVYDRCWHLTSIEKAWDKLRRKLNMQDITLHDFRRTVATRIYEAEKDELLIKAILNHYDGRPIAVYIKHMWDRIAKALQDNADRFWNLKQEGHHDTLALDFTESDVHDRLRAIGRRDREAEGPRPMGAELDARSKGAA